MEIKKTINKHHFIDKPRVNVELIDRILRASNIIHHRSQSSANWIYVGVDLANNLNALYPGLTTQESVEYVNTWCGTTYTTTTISSGSTNLNFPISFSG